MKRCFTILAIFIILTAFPFGMNVHAKEWKTIGANPTTTSVLTTLHKMDVDTGVIGYVQDHFPETTMVSYGMIFNETSEGNAVIKRNVKVAFDGSVPALVWHTGMIDVYYILHCNNVAWKASCPSAQPVAGDSEITSPISPLVPTKADTASWIPDWMKSLLGILAGIILIGLALLFILWIARGLGHALSVPRIPTGAPASPTPVTTTEPAPAPQTPPAPITPTPRPAAPPAPITTPASQPARDRVAELVELLKRLLAQQKELNDQISSVKTELKTEVRAQRHGLDEIEQLLS